MEITKDNYSQYEQQIITDIENSDFISFDIEMTGISHSQNSVVDSPEARYIKYKLTSERYRIIQLGIVTWKFLNEQKTKIESKPYNLYLFPSDDGFINGEVSALIFNRDHGLDFNKWIYKGIDYINEKKYRSLYQNIIEDNINCYNPNEIGKYKNMIPNKSEDLEKCKVIIKDIDQFYSSNDQEYAIDNIPKYMLYYIINHMTEESRNGIYFTKCTLNNKSVIILKKVNKETRAELLAKETENNLKELDKSKGAKRIYDALIKKHAILIGHNSSLDILFLISHFGEPLQSSYQQFKKQVLPYFNGIYDTKLMFEYLPQDKIPLNEFYSTLERMYPYLRSLYDKEIEICIPEGMTNYNHTGSFHDASYDAFVTGSLFVWMTIAFKYNIEKFNHKIFFMKSIFNCFDLVTNEEYASKDCVSYFIKSNRKASDIDLNRIFDSNTYVKIKKVYSADNYNTIILLVKFDNNEEKSQFERTMSKYKQLFNFYSYEKFQELILKDEKSRRNSEGKFSK